MNILFVNQENSQCGVYQFGKNTAFILSKFHHIHTFEYFEADGPEPLLHKLAQSAYDLVILNHHPSVMTWANEAFFANNGNTKYSLIMHDTRVNYPQIASVIHPDPTFEDSFPDLKVGRPVLWYPALSKQVILNSIGSFGFGFDHKGFDDLVNRVNNEFDEATIRIHIPLNSKVDQTGYYAYRMAKKLRGIPLKTGVKLEISHDYKNETELVYWLSEHAINVFLYKNTENLSEGCSSTIDWALMARRPLAVSGDRMFRHITSQAPELQLDKSSLRAIIAKGLEPLNQFYGQWDQVNLYNDYCKVVNETLRT